MSNVSQHYYILDDKNMHILPFRQSLVSIVLGIALVLLLLYFFFFIPFFSIHASAKYGAWCGALCLFAQCSHFISNVHFARVPTKLNYKP